MELTKRIRRPKNQTCPNGKLPRGSRNRVRQLEQLSKAVSKGVVSNDDALKVARKVWEAVDTPLSLGLSILVENGQLLDALKVEFDPMRYLETDWETARDDYQAISIVRKFPFIIEGVDRTDAAWKKFLAAEEQCRTTNSRFRSSRLRGFPPRVEAVLSAASRKMAWWLGDLDPKSWALRCRFGPGADAKNTGIAVSAYHKLSRLSVTPDFIDGALALVRSHPAWERVLLGTSSQEETDRIPIKDVRNHILSRFFRVPGNRVTFVPKTALVDRSIAIEAGMNIYAQLGLGSLIRSRLQKRAGLDLDQQGPNQELAREGSSSGEIATIDLSSASDTLASELVEELLLHRPQGENAVTTRRWHVALDWCRSKEGTYKDASGVETSFRYEKFSSMGNGFTFELESMIFYALALACAEESGSHQLHRVRAYGDDIAVPSECVSLLEEVLGFCGFSVNAQKSFSKGVFRESCGADFFNGINVRPYFLKEHCNNATSLFNLANGLRRVAFRRNFGYGCDRKLYPAWKHVLSRIPESLRELVVPGRPTVTSWADVESSDGGLMMNFDEASRSPWVRFNTDYQRGWYFAELQARPVTTRAKESDWENLFLFGLYSSRDGVSTEATTYDQVVGRGESNVRRLSTRAVSPGWVDLGPWA
jgi:hypothetical protein